MRFFKVDKNKLIPIPDPDTLSANQLCGFTSVYGLVLTPLNPDDVGLYNMEFEISSTWPDGHWAIGDKIHD